MENIVKYIILSTAIKFLVCSYFSAKNKLDKLNNKK